MASLQPTVRQFRGAAVEFVGASFDVGEDLGDPGQVLEFAAAAVPGRGRVRRVVGATGRWFGDRRFPRHGDARFGVGVDG